MRMRRISKLTICLLFLLVLSGCRGEYIAIGADTPQAEKPDSQHIGFIAEKNSIDKAISSSSKTITTDKVYGALVNHHLLAISAMGDLFKALSGQKYSTIVLIGPDHFDAAKNRIAISKENFATPHGLLEPDLVLADKLLGSEYVSIDEDVFIFEHSIGAPVGFIKRNWPNAKFLPVVVSFKANEETVKNLGDKLAEYLPDDSLVIASCDFSHHVDRDTSMLQDAESLAALRSGDIDKIKKAHVDSLQSLIVLELYLTKRRSRDFELVTNTNAADILNDPNYDDVTSYIVGYFKSEER